MVPITALWLPILLSAVAVFVVSSLSHMVLKLHAKDWVKLPNEDATLEHIRTAPIPPGQYMFPNCGSHKDMDSPEMKAKIAKGPIGHMTILPPGGISIGRSLLQWFLLALAVSAGAGYVAGIGLPASAKSVDVFRATAAVALLAHGAASVTDAIWKGVRWGVAAKFLVDAVLYALATGAVFAWLWS